MAEQVKYEKEYIIGKDYDNEVWQLYLNQKAYKDTLVEFEEGVYYTSEGEEQNGWFTPSGDAYQQTSSDKYAKIENNVVSEWLTEEEFLKLNISL